MKEDIIKELNYKLKTQKKTILATAKYCKVSRVTMAKLVNEGNGKISLLEKAREYLK